MTVARSLRPMSMAIVVISLHLSGSGPATAQTCLTRVDALAAQYALTVTAPEAGPDLRSGDLTDSGGVIKPPTVNDRAVIAPPNRGASAMETTPGSSDIAPPLGPAERAIVESVLMAARAEAANGNERVCNQHLGEALEMLRRQP